MNPEVSGPDMAKIQKNFLIDQDLAQLIDKVLELSGMNFTKFATAALLQSLFDHSLTGPETGPPLVGQDATWTSLASRVERGDLKVGAIPEELLKTAIYMVKSNLHDPAHHRDGDKPGWLEIQKRLLTNRELALEYWRGAVKDEGGEIPAALGQIEHCFGRR